MDKCWNISSETNDLVANSYGMMENVTGIEARIVELRGRLMTLKVESEDNSSGLDMNIMMGDAPLYAKQGEIERVALTTPGVLAAKVTNIQIDKKKQNIIYTLNVVFDVGEANITVDSGE